MSEAKKPVLEVRNLSVALPAGADRVHAVEKVSFTVNPGEIVCLVGESGSGKSVIAFTVMGLLAKALKPTEGEILLEGENILAAGETRLRELRCTRMSMIFQEPMTALNPVMTCGLQIDEVLETHTKLDAHCFTACHADRRGGVGISDQSFRRPGDAGIACAIVVHAQVGCEVILRCLRDAVFDIRCVTRGNGVFGFHNRLPG